MQYLFYQKHAIHQPTKLKHIWFSTVMQPWTSDAHWSQTCGWLYWLI